MSLKLLFSVMLFLCAISNNAIAQKESLEQVDKKVAGYLKKINYWAYEFRDTTGVIISSDSVDASNVRLISYFKKSLLSNPKTITFPFDSSIKNGLHIFRSEDGNLTFYCWNTGSGGTWHFYDDIVQYKTSKGVKPEVLNDALDGSDPPNCGEFYDTLFTIKAKSDRTIYLLKTFNQLWTSEDITSIDAYEIKQNKLVRVKAFKTAKKSVSSISYEYDYFSTYDDKTMKEKYYIRLSPDKQMLYIPVVIGTKVTNRNLVYRFNGKQFVYDKNAKN